MFEINTLPFFNIEESRLPSYAFESFSYKEEVYEIDETFQTGSFRRFYLDEFYLERLRLILKQDFDQSFSFDQDQICLCFMLEGNPHISSNRCPLQKLMPGGHNICYLADSKGSIKCPCGAYDFFYIKLSLDTFKSFSPCHQPLFENFIQQIKNRKATVLRQEWAYIRPQIYKIIEDIFNYQGSEHFRNIFIKAKIIELISLQFEQLCGACKTKHPLNKAETSKMYQVRDFILSHLGEYHSLANLSKMAGTNEYTLKKEFKALFGDTVFGFWTRQKMKKAQEMLLEDQKSIKEISEIVGYKNPQHFSTAFKRSFKLSPSQFKKNNL